MELLREAPPAARTGTNGGGSWRAIAEKLRAEPGEWFVVREDARDGVTRVLASRLNRGVTAGWTAGEFEVVARRTEENTTKVHARYVGAGA